MRNRKILSGFSLIELLVAVVIIGILAGVAIPAYLKSTIKSYRTDAKTKLVDTAQRLQRCYTSYGSYVNGSCAVYTLLAADGIITDSAYYQITLSNAAQATFTLTATAIKVPQTDDITQCQTLTLNQTGAKGDAAGVSNTCW